MHCIRPQQSAVVTHGSESVAQQVRLPSSCNPHASSPQHMLSFMQSVPSRVQALSTVHEPTTQISPSQQSASVAQVCTSVWQAHMPSVQSILPQQSRLSSHDPDFSTQQSGSSPRVISRHESPLQHEAAPPAPQGSPGSVHMLAPGVHWKLSQMSPSAHSDESMQNVPSREAAHAPSTHCMKPQQSSEFAQGLPSP